MNNIGKWVQAVNGLLIALSDIGQLGECRFCQGKIDGCEEPDYDDSTWKKVMAKAYPIPGIATETISGESVESELELSDWSMAEGPAALRKVIQIPTSVQGLSTAGTKIYSTLTMLAPIEIYFDGKLAAAYKYWGDSRHCEVVITESFVPGTDHLLVVKTPQNDGDAHLGISLNLEVIEDALLDLSTAVSQLEFAKRMYQENPSDEMKTALESLNNLLDTSAVDNRDWDKIRINFDDIDRELTVFEQAAKQYTVHLIGHSHIDMNWLWDMEDTEDVCIRDFDTICSLLDENPDLRFSQSQICVYDIVHRIRPDLFERAKEKITSGVWDMTAATWSEHDLNTSTGEVFARHNLLSVKYAREMLKAEPSQICWEPDTFGHPATIPNLMVKAGLKYYYHFRKGQEYPMYWWEGTDGSRVLDFCFGPYNNAIRPTNIMPAVYEFLNKLGMRNSMFVYGVGDHGGGPTRRDIQIKRYLDKKPGLPKLVFAGAHKFYETAISEKTDFPVHKGEQNFIFEGVYTTKTKIKKFLRDGEARLLDAEALMAFNAISDADISADNNEAMEAWKHVLFNGFHDISCGCNIAAADRYNYKIGQEAVDTAQALCLKHLSALAGEAMNSGDSHIFVFNQLGHLRTDVVRVKCNHNGSLIDSDGNVVPAQNSNGELIFIAKDVPAFGYKAYSLSAKKAEQPIVVRTGSKKVDGSVHLIETDTYKMEISARTGTITRLHHKIYKTEVLAKLQGEPEVARAFKGEKSSNLVKIQTEEPHIMSAWMIGNIMKTENLLDNPEFSLLECGDVFARVKLSRTYGFSLIEQYITVYNGFDRVDFTLDTDWQELGNNKKGIPFMKVGFTTNITKPRYIYEAPMGWIERHEQNHEVPSLRFVALCDSDFGVNLFNDNKFGFSVDGDSVYMSIVRSSYSPDAVPDKGPISCNYAIHPSRGLQDIPAAVKGAKAFNQPLAAALAGAPKSHSAKGLLSLDNDNVVVSAIKPAANHRGIVVRIVESAGKAANVSLSLHTQHQTVYETNLAEEPLRTLECKNGAVCVRLDGFENKTLLFI